MKRLLISLLALLLCLPCAMAEEKDNRYDAIGGCGFDENTLLPVQRDGLWGFVNAAGELVIPCEWEGYRYANAGKIAVQKDGLWGCLDLAGNMLIAPEWDELSVWSDGSYRVFRGDECALLNAEGEMVTELGAYSYVGYNIDGMLMVISHDDKIGKLNTDGSVAIPAVWDYMGYFSSDRAYATASNGYCYIDRTGAVVIPGPFVTAYDFEGGIAAVRLTRSAVIDGSTWDWNFIDTQGNLLFEEGFAEICRISDGMYVVSRNDKIGYVSAQGELVIPIEYEPVNYQILSASDFSHGRAAVRQNGQTFWIDKEGNRLAELPYEKVEDWGGQLAFVRNEQGLYGAVNADGELIIPCEWEGMSSRWQIPHEDCEIVRGRREGENAFFNQQGENITGRIYDETVMGVHDWHHLYLLENGVLTIWNAQGEQVY